MSDHSLIVAYRSAQEALINFARMTAYRDTRTRHGASVLASFEENVRADRVRLMEAVVNGEMTPEEVRAVFAEDWDTAEALADETRKKELW